MPKLEMGEIDYKAMPSNIHQQHLLRMQREQRKYYWLMFFAGGIIFLASAVVL